MSTNNTYCYSLHQMVVGWFRRRPVNPLSFLAPAVKVDGDTGTYDYFPQGYAFRRVDTSRGRHQSARSLDLICDPRPFALEDHSLRIGIDDRDLHLSKDELDARRSEVAAVKAESRTGTLLTVWETSMIADGFDYFRRQVQARSGVGNWSSSSADPMAEFKKEIGRMETQAGIKPNRILIPSEKWDVLAASPAVLDAITYNSAKELTVDLFKQLLGVHAAPDLQVMVANVPIGKDNAGPNVEFDGVNLLGDDVWLTYAQEGMEVGDFSGLKVLSSGGDAYADNVERYYERGIHTTWHEINMMRTFAVTAPPCVSRLTIS